ncbi:MAG TPA: ABC transporter ATP-binding protein [Acetobacteraceae bacterium]|nr:ABC transporter ATP-binding protein [Acetobacteraceae bacterium]
MAEIQIEGVTKRYAATEVLKRLDLNVTQGEFMVLLGPSGCGKTTLLRMIAGLETPSTGRILMNGQDITLAPPAKRDVGMVFQSYALYPHMTVRQNISLGLRLRKIDEKEITRRIEFVANLVQIAPYLDRKPRALSGGQRQRVALARVIAREPSVSLMDEPLSNIDAQLRMVMRAELLRIHRKVGMTTIYVTHDQEEAMGLGDRITVMNFGHVEQIGAPDEIYSRPANAFVARFIGAPRMNLINARYRAGANSIEAPGIHAPFSASEFSAPSGESIILGFRGEDATPGEAAAGEVTIEGRIDVVEHLGAQMEVHLRLDDGQEAVLRRPRNESWREGDRMRLVVPARNLHLFDAESGAALRTAYH